MARREKAWQGESQAEHFVNISREQLQLQHTLAAPSPPLGICVCAFVRCGAFQFYPFYWLSIFYSCLKFIHKYSDSTRIARQFPYPTSPFLLHLSCLFPLAIPIRVALPLPHLVRFVCKLVYWNFLFAFCPVSSFASPSSLSTRRRPFCHPLLAPSSMRSSLGYTSVL